MYDAVRFAMRPSSRRGVWRYLSIVYFPVPIAIGRWIVLPFRAHRGAAAFSIQYLAGCMRAVGLGGSIKSGSCTTAHLDPARGLS